MTVSASPVLIRRLHDRDIPRIEQHYLRLDPVDRHARFGTALGDASISAYVRRLDAVRAILIGIVDEASDSLIGLVEAQPTEILRRVEIAVSVDARMRNRGIGQRLVRTALSIAFAEGIEVAEFFFASSNRPILGLVRALGARIRPTMDHAEISRDCACHADQGWTLAVSDRFEAPAWRASSWP